MPESAYAPMHPAEVEVGNEQRNQVFEVLELFAAAEG
jgi:hypothetical protein